MKYHFHAATDRFPADGSALLSASMKMVRKVDSKICVTYLAWMGLFFSCFCLPLYNLRTVAMLCIASLVCKSKESQRSQGAYCRQLNTIAAISTSTEPLAPYLIIQAVTWKPGADLELHYLHLHLHFHFHHLDTGQPAHRQEEKRLHTLKPKTDIQCTVDVNVRVFKWVVWQI